MLQIIKYCLSIYLQEQKSQLITKTNQNLILKIKSQKNQLNMVKQQSSSLLTQPEFSPYESQQNLIKVKDILNKQSFDAQEAVKFLILSLKGIHNNIHVVRTTQIITAFSKKIRSNLNDSIFKEALSQARTFSDISFVLQRQRYGILIGISWTNKCSKYNNRCVPSENEAPNGKKILRKYKQSHFYPINVEQKFKSVIRAHGNNHQKDLHTSL